MGAKRARQGARIHQIKITLLGIEPPIWRTVQVRSRIDLAELHDTIQVAMGWYDDHLHMFTVGDKRYSLPDPLEPGGMLDESDYRLEQVAPGPGARLLYEYDFDDGWLHELVVEQVLPPEPGVKYPICVGGARACPPEDVGGPPGYAFFLTALQDPKHPEHETYKEWIEGGTFDPEAFDLEEVNEELSWPA